MPIPNYHICLYKINAITEEQTTVCWCFSMFSGLCEQFASIYGALVYGKCVINPLWTDVCVVRGHPPHIRTINNKICAHLTFLEHNGEDFKVFNETILYKGNTYNVYSQFIQQIGFNQDSGQRRREGRKW